MAKIPPKTDLWQTSGVEDLVKQNLPLVRQIAYSYSKMLPQAREDLIQIGCLGLLKAISYYKPGLEANFRNFAICHIKGEIRHYLRDQGCLIQIPRQFSDIHRKIVPIEEALTRELEHSPTTEEIAQKSGYTSSEVLEAKQSWDNCYRYESLESCENDEGREDTRVLADLVADKRQIDELKYSEDREVIKQALVLLGERTKKVIEFVYFYDFTQKETAQLLGISEMGVSRTIKSALSKLKNILLTEIL